MDALQSHLTQIPCIYCYYLHLGEQYYLNESVEFNSSMHQSVNLNGQESTINCTGDSGWSFKQVGQIIMKNVTFENCASLHQSTTRNQTANSTLEFEVALYFNNCDAVYLDSINTVFTAQTRATGVVLYNPGTTEIKSSNFHNSQSGLVLELTDCLPGDVFCYPRYTTRSSLVYSFENCTFDRNINTNSSVKPLDNNPTIPTGSEYNAFHKGGGLSIIIKGQASYNTFRITDCTFSRNQAQHGGGLFVSSLDSTQENRLYIQRSTFWGNSCPFSESKTSGGGIHFEDFASNYYLSLWESNLFWENKAFIGGGVYITVNPSFMSRDGISLDYNEGIRNSNFTSNAAIFGSALYVHQPVPLLKYSGYLIINNCSFQNNYMEYSSERGMISQTGIATVYSKAIDIKFEGIVNFNTNEGSALVMVSAIANFSTDCEAAFVNNTGTRGGAIALIGDSYMLMGQGTVMKFQDNRATLKGGAIYNHYQEPYSGVDYANCFIRSVDALLSPNLWQTRFVFDGNEVSNGLKANSIHSTSILPCMIQGGAPLCWNNWTYDGDITCNITGHVTTDYNAALSQIGDISAHPGWNFKIPLILRDDLHQNITDNVDAYITAAHDGSLLSVSSEDSLSVNAQIGEMLEVAFESLHGHSMHFELDIDIQVCPPGFIYNLESGCVCPQYQRDGLYCDNDRKFTVLQDSLWIGLINDSSDSSNYYIAPCPKHFCSRGNYNFHVLPNKTSSLSDELCQGNRTGVLCGECKTGHCLAVNSWTMECVVNANDKAMTSSILQYIAAVYVPYLTLLILISAFHIKLTSGSLNAFVLFAQMIATSFDLTEHGKIHLKPLTKHLPNTYRFLYGPFNLDFIEKYVKGFCFSTDYNALSVLLLNYLLFLTPTFSVILIAVCVNIYMRVKSRKVNSDQANEQCRWLNYLRVLSKPCGETVILLLSTLALLSYTKLSHTSAQILYPKKLRSITNGNKLERVFMAGQFSTHDTEYDFYKIPAIFGEIYLLLFIFLLLDYPLRLLEFLVRKVKYFKHFIFIYALNAIKRFTRSFQDCFRPPFRFFASFFFIFRYTISLVHLMSHSSIQKYVVQEITCIIMLLLIVICKPYKDNFHNVVHMCIFINLAVINALNFYQHDYYLLSGKSMASDRVFMIQYTLVISPVVVLLMCVCWKFTKQYTKKFMKRFLPRHKMVKLNALIQSATHADAEEVVSRGNRTEYPSEVIGIEEEACTGLLKCRKEEKARNSMLSKKIPVTVVDVFDKGMGEASTCQTSTSEGYYLKKEWNSGGCGLYGAVSPNS